MLASSEINCTLQFAPQTFPNMTSLHNNDSISLSKPVIEGLEYLGPRIRTDVMKEIISNCMKLTLNPEATITPIPGELLNTDQAKQSEYAIVTVFSLSVKYGLDTILNQLIQRHIDPTVIEELARSYEEHRKQLVLRHLRVCHSFPHITDLQWRILADVKSSSSDHSSGEPSFHINLGRYKQKGGERETIVEFVCNTEELQLLINNFKEIERHCSKVALD